MNVARTFTLLSGDALRDALRNRVGLFALACALLVGLFADRCTGFDTGAIVLNGQAYDLRDGARLVGPVVFGSCSVLLLFVAGFLASDGLARPISDGTVSLWLARPVSRAVYALSRLSGTLALALVAGASVLLGVVALLHLRLGLDTGPGIVGVAIFVADAWVVASLAMTLGLFLPRVVALTLVVLAVQLVVSSNVLAVLMSNGDGGVSVLERFGPPLGTALLYALAPWFSASASAGEWTDVLMRLAVWAVGTSALLIVLFRRLELPS
jgi:ABC-type transport system involved in multi-copper enzyme maturation permease subunit